MAFSKTIFFIKVNWISDLLNSVCCVLFVSWQLKFFSVLHWFEMRYILIVTQIVFSYALCLHVMNGVAVTTARINGLSYEKYWNRYFALHVKRGATYILPFSYEQSTDVIKRLKREHFWERKEALDESNHFTGILNSKKWCTKFNKQNIRHACALFAVSEITKLQEPKKQLLYDICTSDLKIDYRNT